MSTNAFAQLAREIEEREDQRYTARIERRAAFLHTEGFCHEACATDCNECIRAIADLNRSESVGAEWEKADTGPSRRGMRFVPVIGAVVFVLVVAGLAAGVFEDEFWTSGPFASAPSSVTP